MKNNLTLRGNGWSGGWVDEWMSEMDWVDGRWSGGCVDGWMRGWVDEWMGGCEDGWMSNEWMNRSIDGKSC